MFQLHSQDDASETEEVSKVAMQCSKLMTDNVQNVLTDFRDQQRDERKANEEAVKKAIRMKKTNYDQLLRVCLTFINEIIVFFYNL